MKSPIDEYIMEYPEEIQKKLNEIRDIIREIVPKDTIERISWRMPTFYLKVNLIHFAGHKNHIGLYPGPEAIEMFKDELDKYKNTKGAIQFKYEEKLPKELIQKIVKFKIEQVNK